MTGDSLPARRGQPDELSQIESLIGRATRTVPIELLVARGKRSVRMISRKQLIQDVLRAIQSVAEQRVRQAEARLGEIVEQREATAREEGRMRVLVSLTDLADLVDSVSLSLGAAGARATKALDRRVDRIFKSYGFERTPTVGHAFDPRLHEAIEEQAIADVEPDTVIEEVSRGYRRDDFVLRVARVIVAAPPSGMEVE